VDQPGQGSIYVLGGMFKAEILSRVEAYDPPRNTWSTRSCFATPTIRLSSGPVGDKIYAIGGFRRFMGELATVEEYDLPRCLVRRAAMHNCKSGIGSG